MSCIQIGALRCKPPLATRGSLLTLVSWCKRVETPRASANSSVRTVKPVTTYSLITSVDTLWEGIPNKGPPVDWINQWLANNAPTCPDWHVCMDGGGEHGKSRNIHQTFSNFRVRCRAHWPRCLSSKWAWRTASPDYWGCNLHNACRCKLITKFLATCILSILAFVTALHATVYVRTVRAYCAVLYWLQWQYQKCRQLTS